MSLYTNTVTLILVMDPLGNIPIFLSILKNFDFKAQRRIMIREAFIAFIVLMAFLFGGSFLMESLSLTTSALSIAGSIVLFLISLKLMFPDPERDSFSEPDSEEPFIVPLAIPLIAGPSAMAVVMLRAATEPNQFWNIGIAITIASVVGLVFILLAHWLMRLLGRRVLLAIERLMGMILITIAVQMCLTGMLSYLHQ